MKKARVLQYKIAHLIQEGAELSSFRSRILETLNMVIFNTSSNGLNITLEVNNITDTYFRYSDGGTNFRNRETITMVDVRLSRTELRKNVTIPICKFNVNLSTPIIERK